MDIELRQHLDAMEARIEARSVKLNTDLKQDLERQITDVKEGLERQIKALEARSVRLTTDLKESLERQINTGFEDMASRFDAQSMRLDRQAALIQAGSRWTNRMNDWAENVDVALEKKSQEIAELRTRLEKIDGRPK